MYAWCMMCMCDVWCVMCDAWCICVMCMWCVMSDAWCIWLGMREKLFSTPSPWLTFTAIPLSFSSTFLHFGAMPDPQQQDEQLQQIILLAIETLSHITYKLVMDHLTPLYLRTPYHTSALFGADWVHKLLTGHPKCIQNELGINWNTFIALVNAIQVPEIGLQSSCHISIEEQLLIFLYTAVTGLSCTHVGECF